MTPRLVIGSAVAAALIGSGTASAKPDFVPAPGGVYRDYEAIEMPRSDVPVGALWVQDYGPTGEGAAADNLVTERSLSQVTISSDLQLNWGRLSSGATSTDFMPRRECWRSLTTHVVMRRTTSLSNT